jgi:hypothetical protein
VPTGSSVRDRILSGTPVQQPMKVTLISRKTARAVGLSIPETLLVIADGVIE